MASKTNQGYQPIAPIDWQELLQSLVNSVENFKAGCPSEEINAISRAGRIQNYVLDLEHCLKMTNSAIDYYEKLTANYDRLVAVMEESRNFAYDTIGRLKDEIKIRKEFKPLIYAAEMVKEAQNEHKAR